MKNQLRVKSAIIMTLLLFCCSIAFAAQTSPSIIVLSEAGFPAADTAAPSQNQLKNIFPAAHFVSVNQLETALNKDQPRLLVLPYGSAFPEQSWPSIFHFLQTGGNLLVLGGQPFTRAAYRDAAGWKLRDYSVRFIRPLMIDQYQETMGSENLTFQANSDIPLQLSPFAWKRAFSPVIRLSSVDLYKRDGATGSIDARLDPLVWGVKDQRKLTAPAIQIDHLRNGFDGGRWIFLNAELPAQFYDNPQTKNLIQNLVAAALQGSQEFTVRPVWPLYMPG